MLGSEGMRSGVRELKRVKGEIRLTGVIRVSLGARDEGGG